jgi:hypothetical protein
MVIDVLKELKKYIRYNIVTLTPPYSTPEMAIEHLVSSINKQ